MFKLWCFVLITAFSWQLSTCRYIGQSNYHSIQPYQAQPYQPQPYPDYGYSYSGPSFYQPSPYQLSPYQSPSPSYSPPGTYYDHRRGILRPFPGGGVPVLVDYHKRCSNQYVGLKPHPEDHQYYYVCKPDSVIFGKCQNLQVFNSTCGQCVQYPRPEYMPNCEYEGRFPIYSDCRIYFKCEEDLVPQMYSCPQNMIFSPANQKCKAGNHCAITQISNSGSNIPKYCEGKFPPCYENGVFRSPADCSLYYTCELQTSGVFLQTRLRCTEGHFYDKQKNQCLPKQHVSCDCIQVAELVYPKPNHLPFHSSYPAQFDIDSLEENYYPIEKSEEDNDSLGDGSGDESTVVTPQTTTPTTATQSTTTPTPATQSTTAVPVSSTEPDVTTNETTDEINVLDDSIDVNNETLGDALARIEKTTAIPEDDNETTVPSVTTEAAEENSTTITPVTPANTTIATPVNSTVVTSTTEATTEPDVFTTKPVEETTIPQDLEGSGSGSETTQSTTNPEENTTDTDDTTKETTTVAEDSSSSVSPTTPKPTTTPAAPANSTIASVQPQSASRSQSKEDTDTQTLNQTLSPPTPTPEVPVTQTVEATTQTPTTLITETPIEPTTESFTDVTLEDDVGLLDSEIQIDDFKQTSQKKDTTLDLVTEELLPISTTKISFTTTVQEQETTTAMPDIDEGSEITETTSTQEPPTTIQNIPLTTINPTEVTATPITEDTTAAFTDSTTDVTLEDDEMGLLDSDITIDDSKNLLEAEDLLPVSAKPTVATTVQTEKSTLTPDEATTETPTPTITTEASTIVSTENITEDPTTEYFTDVPLEDDVLGLLDSEISLDENKESSPKDEDSVNNLLAAEEMLPVKITKSTKPIEEQETEGTTLWPETDTETTVTDQTITTDSPTTHIPTNPTTSVTEMPTTATTESSTDVTLEDDEMGLLDSEIFIDDAKPASHKDQTSIDNNLLVAEDLIPVKPKTSVGDEGKKTTELMFDDVTSVPEEEETTISPQTTTLETSTTTEQPSETTIKPIEDIDDIGILDSELVLDNKKEVSEKTDATMATTEAITVATDPVTSTELPVTQPALTTFVNTDDDLITAEDELGLLDSEVNLPDVRTNQASSVIPSTPDTTEKTTQTSATTVTPEETTTVNPPPTQSTTITTTQTPTVTPKCSTSTTKPTPHSLLIQVREDNNNPSPNNSPNKSLYFTLHTKPVINNNNTNSCNQTVTEPPCDKPNTGEIPRLEIIAERPIDVHFSICPPKCDKDHKHNYSPSSNRAVQIKWYPNKSNQTMSFETSSNIKTEGDNDC